MKAKKEKRLEQRCPACKSGDTYPVRGKKGAHWWVCSRCREEF